MKSFLQFLSEARETQASTQARKLGLVGDGHGGWKDRTGKYVAKTEDGELKFFGSNQAAKPEESKVEVSKEVSKPSLSKRSPATGNSEAQKVAADKQKKSDIESESDQKDLEKSKGALTIVFGRFNPPTIGHEKLLTSADKVSVGGNLKIYPSRSQDPKKNPLKPDTKISFMRKMFPKFGEKIINDTEMKTIFDVLTRADEDGYSNVNIVVGSDRQSEFENLANKYNGNLYDFEEINVVSAGVRDADAEGIEGMSASKMRKAAAENDFVAFRSGIPKDLDDTETKKLFTAVRSAMNIKEGYEMWQIAPKFDWKGLRENFISRKIFNVNDIVENLNTGMVGKVIRRGTNHLICVAENGMMFKSWIKDLNEYTEVKMDSPMRDTIHPNTLTGTKGMFVNYAKMTPGAIGTNKQYLQQGGKAYGIDFINKYKKIKESIYSNV